MADSEIQPAAAAQETPSKKAAAKKSAKKRDKPDDAVKLGCGGLFRRKKKSAKAKEAGGGEENGGGADAGTAGSKAPVEKPAAPPAPAKKGGSAVKIEETPQSQMWNGIVANSMVGTGIFKRAVACSLATGGILARSPAEFTPSAEQVATLRDNFDNRGVFSAAGFSVAETVFSLQEETGSPEILSGADAGQTEGVLVARSNTALIIGTFAEKLDLATETLSELRRHIADQGL